MPATLNVREQPMTIWQRMLRLLGLQPEPPIPVPVTLYTRTACHLCDEALKLLRSRARRAQILPVVEIIDIDHDPELIARYGDKVPVLVIAGKERLWGNFNPVWLRRTLEAEAARLRKTGAAARSSANATLPPPLKKGG